MQRFKDLVDISSITQERLNQLITIHIHKELTDTLTMKEIAIEKKSRVHIFGNVS